MYFPMRGVFSDDFAAAVSERAGHPLFGYQRFV